MSYRNRYPTESGLGKFHRWSGNFEEKKNLLSFPGTETWYLDFSST